MIFTSIKKVIRTDAFSSCYKLNFAAPAEASPDFVNYLVKCQGELKLNNPAFAF